MFMCKTGEGGGKRSNTPHFSVSGMGVVPTHLRGKHRKNLMKIIHNYYTL